MSATALVTGGSGGIGAAIVRALLERGHEVVSLSRDKPQQTHDRLHAMTVDLEDMAATKQVAADIMGRHAISHIVHCAGVTRHKPLEEADVADIDALAHLHLGAALILLQAALLGMKQRKFGRIILISSRAALGVVGRTAYSATKAGMIGMGRTWALELAPFGITVNVVAPGPIGGTAMFHDVIPAGGEREAALANAIPVKRLGRPEDVANAVMFFASTDSGFVTGQTLYVCGGASVGTIVL